MKWGAIALVAGAAAWPLWSAPAQAQATCTRDISCSTGGVGCGTMVCNRAQGAAMGVCVPAGTAPGYCAATANNQMLADATCKCQALGATCQLKVGSASYHHCTFTTPSQDGGVSDSGMTTDSGTSGDAGVDSGDSSILADAGGGDDGGGNAGGSGSSSGAGGSGSSSGGASGSSLESSGSSSGSSGTASGSDTTGGTGAGNADLSPSPGRCSFTVGASAAPGCGFGVLALGAGATFVRRRRRR